MSPSHTRKAGMKYRYYLSSALLQGQPKQAGSIRRVPAAEIETVIVRTLRERFKQPVSNEGPGDRTLINTWSRVSRFYPRNC
jgi:hypothetical protein